MNLGRAILLQVGEIVSKDLPEAAVGQLSGICREVSHSFGIR